MTMTDATLKPNSLLKKAFVASLPSPCLFVMISILTASYDFLMVYFKAVIGPYDARTTLYHNL
jgi:hypothetical protein